MFRTFQAGTQTQAAVHTTLVSTPHSVLTPLFNMHTAFVFWCEILK